MSSTHAGVLFVGDEVLAHHDVVVLDGLHVLDVIFKTEKLAEAEVTEHFYGGFLLADEFRLDSFESALAGDFYNFSNQGASETASAETRMDMDADAADVAFPPA